MAEFGDYEILDRLGRGGMGAVYKARHLESGQIAALKMLTASGVTSKAARQRFMVEARSMARLRHRNIVSVHEVGEVRGVPFLAMDYLQGRTLQEIIREGTPDPQVAARWLIGIARAVEHAHEHGIIHRDLKPSNVIMDPDGQPVVMDFGLAKDVVADIRLTMGEEIIGTPSYMSPEQVEGRALDARSDIFALGGILYALLAGRAPFKGSATVVMFKVRHREPPPLAELTPEAPADLQATCRQAMRKAPEDRYPTAAAMAADLEAFLAGEPVTARRESRITRAFSAVRRRKPLLAAGLFGMLIVVAATLWASFPREEPPDRPNPPPPVEPPVEPPPGPEFSDVLAEIDQLIADQRLDRAEDRCREVLAQNPPPPTRWKEALEQRLTSIAESRAAGEEEPSEPPPDEPDDGATVAEGDRFLAACCFEEAAASYQSAGAGAARQEMAQRLLDLRNRAAQGLKEGAWRPVALQSGQQPTLVSIERDSVTIADVTGTDHRRSWDSFAAQDVYNIYLACLSDLSADDHLDLGLLCHALGLAQEAQAEFAQAIQMDPGKRSEVDSLGAVQLSP